ncbi:MAG: diaminopimelate epimerase [Legionella sp.]|nr:MAG: diaminopimelate epimerase [Legionella sp.]
MTFQFTKMHGLGNDFILIDATKRPLALTSKGIAALSHRHTGIGFDQCLVVEHSTHPDVDFFYRIFNADGQEVGQCGNGARCLARFVHHQGLTTKQQICIQTPTTLLHLTIHDDHSVTVGFAPPQFEPQQIPINSTSSAVWYQVTQGHQTHHFHAIQVGNPHAVLLVDDLDSTDVSSIGQYLSTHSFFPQQANIGFLQIIHPQHIRLRVYERGCGETQACGSGAVAAAAVGMLYHQLADEVRVSLPGGDLWITWPNHTGAIYLRGPATFVYDGQLVEEER